MDIKYIINPMCEFIDVDDGMVCLEENMETIDSTKQKFQNYRETVKKRALELEEQNINIDKDILLSVAKRDMLSESVEF